MRYLKKCIPYGCTELQFSNQIHLRFFFICISLTLTLLASQSLRMDDDILAEETEDEDPFTAKRASFEVIDKEEMRFKRK